MKAGVQATVETPTSTATAPRTQRSQRVPPTPSPTLSKLAAPTTRAKAIYGDHANDDMLTYEQIKSLVTQMMSRADRTNDRFTSLEQKLIAMFVKALQEERAKSVKEAGTLNAQHSVLK